MPDNPDVPDLKKQQEAKPAGFAWTAASAATSVQRLPPPTFGEKIQAALKERFVIIGGFILLIVGGLAFGLMSVGYSGSDGTTLGGVASSVKLRKLMGRDSSQMFQKLEDPAAAPENRLGLVKTPDAIKAANDAMTAAQEAGAGGLNYDIASGAGKTGVGSAGGAPSLQVNQRGGATGGGEGGGAAAASKLAGSVSMRGMQRVSGTAGFRGLKGGRGISRTLASKGNSALASGGSNRADSADGRTAQPGSLGDDQYASGAIGSTSRGRDTYGGGGGGSSGGGGGGAGDGSTDLGKTPEDYSKEITKLLQEASDADQEYEKEKKWFIAANATGNHAQSLYHWDKMEKAKKESAEKKAEANKLTVEMAVAAEQQKNETLSNRHDRQMKK